MVLATRGTGRFLAPDTADRALTEPFFAPGSTR